MPTRAYRVGTEHEEPSMARARSFGNIRKLPSGRYQARYWHLGKQIAADTTFANKTDARRWLATVEADMVRGDLDRSRRRQDPVRRVRDPVGRRASGAPADA